MTANWWSSTLLVARREWNERIGARSYRITTIVLVLAVVLAVGIPALVSGPSKPHKVGVVGGAQGIATVREAGAVIKQQVQPVPFAGVTAATSRLRSGDLSAVYVVGRRVLIKQTPAGGTSSPALADAIAQLGAGGHAAAPVAAALPVSGLEPAAKPLATRLTGMAVAILIYILVLTYGQRITSGVVEEKSSRVVELVLSAVRPLQLLAGKLIGIGTLAAAQVLLLGTVALIAASAARTLTIPASGIASVAVAFVGFLLGFAFFSALAAALASTVSRQEEVSGVMAPVTIMLMLCYGAGFGAAFSSGSTFARIVSVVPPFSAIAMPARIARGPVPVIDLVLAVVLLAAAATGILAVAARIYRASVLHSGTRVSLRRAWQGEAVAELG
jgi:ABC-2 type transport system permease protein